MHSLTGFIADPSFFENYAEAVLITSATGQPVFMNTAFSELTGYAGKDLAVLQIAVLFQNHPNPAEARYFETNLTCKNKSIHVKISSSKITFTNQSESTEGSVYTIRKEADLANLNKELKRSNEELEQFAYVASHDLQEPLRTISGYIHLIQKQIKKGSNEGIDDFMGFAVEAVGRTQALISDLLQFSRVGRNGNPFTQTDLNEVLNIVLAHLSAKIKELDAQITFEKMPVLKADSSQLTRLFQNLIDNAIKFHAADRKPQINISVKEQAENYVFAVQDNGIGIEDKFYNRIFAIFQRLHTRSQYEGTGIGLAVCKKIVERHGGEIWVASEPEKGSTFYFTLKKQTTE